MEPILFKIQRFSVHDGPGIRTAVFFKGCPLRCKWCHNPEALTATPDILFIRNLCTSCNTCNAQYSEVIHEMDNGSHTIARDKIIELGIDKLQCPNSALVVAGKRVAVESIMEIIKKDVDYYRESNGGATFSGGEPLLQHEALRQLVAECRQLDISTCLDTCGLAPSAVFNDIASQVDHILFDIKAIDAGRHKELTGVDNITILENFKYGCEKKINMLVRYVIVPGVNDTDNDMNLLAEFLASVSFDGPVELLSYHDLGINKYRQLDMKYALAGSAKPDEEYMRSHVENMQAKGVNANVQK